MEYQIVIGGGVFDLADLVSDRLTGGWEPIGGPFIDNTGCGRHDICQAMIRKPKKSRVTKEVSKECYVTAKGVILNKDQTVAFEQFWTAFALPKDKAKAADSWHALGVGPKILPAIIAGAEREAKARPAMVADGRTPKWAQGWLSGRRWEDGAAGGGGIRPWHETGPGIEAKGKEYGIEQGDMETPYFYQKIKAEARDRGEL